MAFESLRDYIALLDNHGQLLRIREPVSPILEITEFTDRLCKGPAQANQALLFEQLPGYSMPLLINAFGSSQRMAWALGVQDLEELNHKLGSLLDTRLPKGMKASIDRGAALARALLSAGVKPKKLKASNLSRLGRGHPRAPVQQVLFTEALGHPPSLSSLPILKCWPQDGGRFITLPQVITRDPTTGVRNVGMYRLQEVDERTLLVHWQRHKGGAEHERLARQSRKAVIPAAVVLGGDPACTWCASAPLPPNIDEYLLAGFLRGSPVEFVDCVTQPLEVPANSDIVIEGVINPNRHQPEGPFGDHTGYYTPVEPFPAFQVTAITMRENPVYPTTIVGIPPQEDAWMGKATERLFLPLLRLFLPEVVDINMPAEGVFHNLVLVSIQKRYPGHARKVIFGLWGLALLSLAKAIVVVDEWVDIQDLSLAAWQALGNVDWTHDVVIADGPVDHLDHASRQHSFGGKIGIDATAKLPEEGYRRSWPQVIRMDPQVKQRVDQIWKKLGLF